MAGRAHSRRAGCTEGRRRPRTRRASPPCARGIRSGASEWNSGSRSVAAELELVRVAKLAGPAARGQKPGMAGVDRIRLDGLGRASLGGQARPERPAGGICRGFVGRRARAESSLSAAGSIGPRPAPDAREGLAPDAVAQMPGFGLGLARTPAAMTVAYSASAHPGQARAGRRNSNAASTHGRRRAACRWRQPAPVRVTVARAGCLSGPALSRTASESPMRSVRAIRVNGEPRVVPGRWPAGDAG